MRRVTFLVSTFINIAGFTGAKADQAYLAGTENVIDLKKIEVPQLKDMFSAVEEKKSNRFFTLKLNKELNLNGQKVIVYQLKKRFFWESYEYPLPWHVSVNEKGQVIEINGVAKVADKLEKVDLILSN